MICEQEIHMQSPSVVLEVNLDPSERQKLHAAMVLAGVALKKLRIKKLSRDSHQRRYARWGHIDRLKARDFAKSPRGREYYRQYNRERRKKPHYHFRNWLYGAVNRALRKQGAKKCGRTEEIIGCTRQAFIEHLESQFVNGFSWENRSTWHVDHIVPTSEFNLCDREEQLCAFNYKNCRPMESRANQSKSDTIPVPLPSWLPAHIAERIVKRKEAK